MVTPMIKYTFLIHHAHQQQFIDALGTLGAVDVTVNGWEPDSEERSLMAAINQCKQTIDKLHNLSAEFKNTALEEIAEGPAAICNADATIETVTKTVAHNEQLKAAYVKALRERDELAVWGDFSVDMLNRLKQSGITLYFYMIGRKLFDREWENTYRIEVVNTDNEQIHFVVVVDDGKAPTLPGAVSIRVPETTVREKETEMEELQNGIHKNNRTLARCIPQAGCLETHLEEMKTALAEAMIKDTRKETAGNAIHIIEGWVPETKTADVDKLFETDPDVIQIKDKPAGEDAPPILLKNNRFARLSEMISKLYSMPSYYEWDLTPFFAPFFIFFVGICFGDLGYGILVFVIALIVNLTTKNKAIKPITSLVMWCAFAAMIMGAVTGTFMGIELQSVPRLSHLKFMQQMDMFSFALMVGGVQLLYAMFIKAISRIKRFGFKYGISTLAWIAALLSTGLTFILPSKGIEFTMSSPIYIVIVCLCLLLNIFFFDPSKKNLLSNFGSGLWELYNSVTGLLGDVLSYIRLFALGLSSAIIASVFNDLAVGMSGDTPVLKYVIMILILLVGHSINIFMSAISSFVHPLRLTFVEFYKNAGFEGGGREYKPFRKKQSSPESVSPEPQTSPAAAGDR